MQRNFRGMGILSISIFIGMLILMGMAMDLFAHNYEESGRNQKYMQEITFSDKVHNINNFHSYTPFFCLLLSLLHRNTFGCYNVI